jgi:HSP20 family protein
MDLPGVDEKAVQVRFEGGTLTVEGERLTPSSEDVYAVRERLGGEFRRSFRLPEAIDSEKIEARYERGVLEIRVPKVDRSRRIEIQ